jgi:4-hydroxymandelate oxidase
VTPDVAELERRARARLSPDVYDFYAGGSGREATLRANAAAWQQVRFLPHVLRDVSAVDTHLTLAAPLGLRLATPVAVAPAAYQRLAHPDGEVGAARGTARAGALYVLSTRSTCRIEDVGAAVAAEGGAWWFQVYLMRDRELTARLVRRAAAAGASALVLTLDTTIVGRKARTAQEDVIGEEDFLVNLGPLADLATADLAPDVTVADIGWLRELSGLPVVVKGVLRTDDALTCVTAGAAAIIVSNHGGRQLDQALPAAQALPAVAAARPGQVHVDGGVRTGADVLAALALGAGLVFLGRPVLWALACGGGAGVQALVEGFTDELAHLMALGGITAPAGAPGILAPGNGAAAP